MVDFLVIPSFPAEHQQEKAPYCWVDHFFGSHRIWGLIGSRVGKGLVVDPLNNLVKLAYPQLAGQMCTKIPASIVCLVQMSHNQNLVLECSAPNHVKNLTVDVCECIYIYIYTHSNMVGILCYYPSSRVVCLTRFIVAWLAPIGTATGNSFSLDQSITTPGKFTWNLKSNFFDPSPLYSSLPSPLTCGTKKQLSQWTCIGMGNLTNGFPFELPLHQVKRVLPKQTGIALNQYPPWALFLGQSA